MAGIHLASMTVLSAAVLVVIATPCVSGLGPVFCGEQVDGITTPGHQVGNYLDLSCQPIGGDVIASISFASYGTAPTGTCGNWKATTCDTLNTTIVIDNICVGKNNCRIWPNTTTFGDPCFGTQKFLYVEAFCRIGAGSAKAGCVGTLCPVTPPPPPPPAGPVTVTVDLSNITGTLATVPSLQVVAHALLMRNSPIHDILFENLAAMNASWVRYVPWLPTPLLGVAELEPPSGTHLCGESVKEGTTATLSCGPYGGVITSIDFASFGPTQVGRCGNYSYNGGTLDVRKAVVNQCVGNSRCNILALASTFGLNESVGSSPSNRLAVQARCSNSSQQFTYWNFTLLDDHMLDYWNAVRGDTRPQIPNFSTPPTWLYDATDWSYSKECTQANGCKSSGYEKGAAPANAHGGLPALGDYYGRLLSWYMRGGMTDEYGNYHTSGHHLNITIWEIYNEVDYEHGHTPVTYTQDFDAIVQGIRKHADPNKSIAFVGMSLPNIDNTATVVEWATYFLNKSNHAEDVQDALQYIGYHAYPTSSYPMKTKDDLKNLFAYVDDFIDNKVASVQDVIDKMSPNTRTCLDETGTTGPMFPGTLDDPTYWVASGSYWAYMWARASVAYGSKIAVVGQSQFIDSPDREPGVTMMDWRNGNGTAKYWINRLIIGSVSLGDEFTATIVNATGLYAQAIISSSNNSKRVLLINKQYANITVTLAGATTAIVVDENHQFPPASEACSGKVLLGPYATAVVTLGDPYENPRLFQEVYQD